MEIPTLSLKEFVKKVLVDLDTAVSEANEQSGRDIRFKGVKEQRTAVEFDVAVTVQSTNSNNGEGEVKVLGLIKAGGGLSAETLNSTVSRVSFGVDIDSHTRIERERFNQQFRASNDPRNSAR